MDHRHKIALVHPCYLAGETMHPRYASFVGRWVSVVLTVNAGYE